MWTPATAHAWYDAQPWLVGCNYMPRTAINQLEMWQAETFDPATIDQELGWARGLGMNLVRIYLHDLAWAADPEGFLARVREVLTIAERHGIRALLTIFDDCWRPEAALGAQPAPLPGVHNSGWVQSPAAAQRTDTAALESYVRAVIGAFACDPRVAMWDLYNEPGNSDHRLASLPLLRAVYAWARAAAPTQPLTSAIWWDQDPEIIACQVEASDIITFHHYGPPDDLRTRIADLRRHGRPLLCSEWLARGQYGSEVATNLPLFHAERVGCCCWGLVSGKTQTIYPWGSPGGEPEPTPWHHDLLRPDGAPYRAAEAACFRALTGMAGSRV